MCLLLYAQSRRAETVLAADRSLRTTASELELRADGGIGHNLILEWDCTVSPGRICYAATIDTESLTGTIQVSW